MLFGIQQIGTAAVLEDTHVIGPRGGYGTGVHTMLDHGTDIAAAYEFLEKGGKEFVADTEVSVSVYEIAKLTPPAIASSSLMPLRSTPWHRRSNIGGFFAPGTLRGVNS